MTGVRVLRLACDPMLSSCVPKRTDLSCGDRRCSSSISFSFSCMCAGHEARSSLPLDIPMPAASDPDVDLDLQHGQERETSPADFVRSMP